MGSEVQEAIQLEAMVETARAIREVAHEIREARCEIAAAILVLRKALSPLQVIVQSPQSGPATAAFLSVQGGSSMAGLVTVDTVSNTLVVNFQDNKGAVGAPPPVGVQGTATFDDPLLSIRGVLAIVAAPGGTSPYGDTLQAPLVVTVPQGGISGPTVVNVTVVLTKAGGEPLFEADGFTSFGQPLPLAIPVYPGSAVGAQLAVPAPAADHPDSVVGGLPRGADVYPDLDPAVGTPTYVPERAVVYPGSAVTDAEIAAARSRVPGSAYGSAVRASARSVSGTQGGSGVGATVTVDSVNSALVVAFVDDDQNQTQPPASVAVAVVFDGPELSAGAFVPVAGSNTPWNDTLRAPLAIGTTVAGPTQVTATAKFTSADGSPLFEADGVTPFVQPQPFVILVDPGAAVGAQLAVA